MGKADPQKSQASLLKPDWLELEYARLERRQKEIANQMAGLNWQFHQITGGWINQPRTVDHAIAVARFCRMSEAERVELARDVEAYIQSRGGECLALELGEVFADRIPRLKEFMAKYTQAKQQGVKRTTTYRLNRPDPQPSA